MSIAPTLAKYLHEHITYDELLRTRFPLAAMTLLCAIIPAQAQDLPAGPGKEIVASACRGCHRSIASEPDTAQMVGAL
jgi:hypothetical protein